MTEQPLCPFSKPIIGDYCRCPHAQLAERCSGKMVCAQDAQLRPDCEALVELLKQNAHFVLSMSNLDDELTHAQSMKIRCGGLLGMQRVLDLASAEVPLIPDVMNSAVNHYGKMEDFPFDQIMPDIQGFNHRRKLRKTT